MSDHAVAREGDIAEGERLAVELEGQEVFVYNVGGEYRAYVNWCPHQGGPACEGVVSGTEDATFDREALEVEIEWVREGEVLLCPWHGWEFDLTTGAALARPDVSLVDVEVRREDGEIVVSL